MDKILLVDDDKSLQRVTEYNLESAGFQVITADSAEGGLALFHRYRPELVITDVKLGGMNGIEFLLAIKEVDSETPVIVITAFGSIELAVQAMQNGAFNFLTKPFDREVLRQTCKKALDVKALQNQKSLLEQEIDRLTGTVGMETANSAMAELLDKSMKAASSDASILITGETGTGKDVLARLIHRNSFRVAGPLVCVNCAALPPTLIESELFGHVKGAFTGAITTRKGRFQAADRGTLFLDEIGELQFGLQAKLLRVLQEKEVEPVGSEGVEKVDVRLITATNKDLKKAIADNNFREDLFYRLGVIELYLPPLRERKEDLPGLTSHFLKQIQAPESVEFSEEALALLHNYSWPGNIRELQNVIERSVILRKGDTIGARELNLVAQDNSGQPAGVDLPTEGVDLVEIEKTYIRAALKKSGGNMSEAARLLSIPRHVLVYRLEKYNISKSFL